MNGGHRGSKKAIKKCVGCGHWVPGSHHDNYTLCVLCDRKIAKWFGRKVAS